jgi:hypothetical protein
MRLTTVSLNVVRHLACVFRSSFLWKIQYALLSLYPDRELRVCHTIYQPNCGMILCIRLLASFWLETSVRFSLFTLIWNPVWACHLSLKRTTISLSLYPIRFGQVEPYALVCPRYNYGRMHCARLCTHFSLRLTVMYSSAHPMSLWWDVSWTPLAFTLTSCLIRFFLLLCFSSSYVSPSFHRHWECIWAQLLGWTFMDLSKKCSWTVHDLLQSHRYSKSTLTTLDRVLHLRKFSIKALSIEGKICTVSLD